MTRRFSYLGVVVLLSYFVYAHTSQAWDGLQVLGFNAPIWAKAIGGLYALVNASVVVAQVSLLIRATRFFWKAPFPRTTRKSPLYTLSEFLLVSAVTIGGQAVFWSVYHSYK